MIPMAAFLNSPDSITSRMPDQAVQRTGASRFARRQVQHPWRLAPVADLGVRHEGPATSSAFDATSTIVMTTLQKALSIVVLIVIGGALIYEARKASALTAQVQGLHREQALLSEQNEKLTRQRDEA